MALAVGNAPGAIRVAHRVPEYPNPQGGDLVGPNTGMAAAQQYERFVALPDGKPGVPQRARNLPDPNLANLLGDGESTFLVDIEPSNVFTLPAGIGSQFVMRVTNGSKWPQLLKAWGVSSSVHKNWTVQVTRGDGRAVIGDGIIHARQITGTSVPALFGPGIQLERLAALTFTFTNLSAGDATDLRVVFKSLKIANPEGLPSGKTLREQIDQLNKMYAKWSTWGGLNPLQRGLGTALLDNGRYYTFPLTQGIDPNRLNDTFGAVVLAGTPLGTPIRGSFRNETGGTFVCQWIAWNSARAGVAAVPFTFFMQQGGGSWFMTEGAVDSRSFSSIALGAHPGGVAGTNSIDQWTPLWLPKPWVIEDQTTVVTNFNNPVDVVARDAVWFLLGGVLIGGSVI